MSENQLNCDTILEAEFNYIAQTVFQNHEDRANTTTFYLAAIGSFVAAILSADQNGLHGSTINLAFAGLFFLLGLIGVRTLLELAQLRRAWFDSVLAMNSIKQYYLNHSESELKLDQAFHWNLIRCPAGFKAFSISSLLAYQTAALASGCFGVSGYFFCQHVADGLDDIGSALLGLFVISTAIFAGLIFYYGWLLRNVEKQWNEVKGKLCQQNPSSST